MKFTGIFILSYLLYSVVKCEPPSLIGSYFMPSESDYQVFLAGKSLNGNSAVNISLKSDRYEEAVVRYSGDSVEDPIKFTLPNDHHSSYQLKLKYYENIRNKNSCKQQSVKLINMAKRPIVLIQLDKPVYNPGDVMKFRIFVLSQKLVPFDKIDGMNVAILDGAQKIVKELNDLETSEFGVYEDLIKLPETLNLGTWKINVEINGRKNSKSFNVEKFDKTSLQANLITDDEVALANQKINFGINVKHPIDKFFFGTAKISFSRGNMKNVKKMLIKTLKMTSQYTTVELDIEDDLGVTSIRTDMDLNFDIEVVDYTGTMKTLISKTVILKNNDIKISTTERNFFIPGIEFPVNVEVRKLNGQLDNSYESLEVAVEYQNEDDSNEDEFQVDLDKGRKTINLVPTQDTKEIKLKLNFGEVEVKKVFKSSKLLGISHYIQASVADEKKDYKIDGTAIISAKTSEEIESINFLVLGPNGIVHNEVVKEDQWTDEFKINVKITELMIPQSNVIAYYVRGDGNVVHDSVPLSVGFPANNQLELSMPQEANGNTPVSISIKTEEKSMVFLTATDSMQEQNNELSMSLIKNSLTAANPDKKSDFNVYGAFILKQSETGQCNNHFDQLDSTFSDDFDDLTTNTEILASKFIPSVWFDDEHVIDAPEKIIEKMSPNSPGKWRVQGVAIHPTKGFSVADSQPIITISKNSSLMVKGPPSVRETEAFIIECSCVNLNENDRDLTVRISVENGEILDESTKRLLKNPSESSKLLKFKNTRSITANFLVRAKSKGTLNAKITLEDEKSELDIQVKAVKVPFKQISQMEMTAIAKNGKREKIVIKNEASRAGIKETFDNLLGPSLDGLEKLFNPQYDLTEFKVDNLATWIISCKHQNTDHCKVKLNESYEAVTTDLKALIAQNIPSSVRLVAYISETLTDAMDFIGVDQRLIFKCLDFIKSHQKSDGSFPYDENLNSKRGIGASNMQEILLVSKVLQAFTDSGLKTKYKYEVKKSINYLNKSKNQLKKDYEKILVAYTLALHGDTESAKDLIYKISCNFMKSTLYTKHKSMFVEIASYTILTKVLLNADTQNEVKWLMSQRNADGGFYSPHDTVLALRALYEFSKYARESGLIATKEMQSNKVSCNILNIPQTNSDYDEPQAFASMPYNLTYSVVYQESDLITSKFFKTCAEIKSISEVSVRINVEIEFSPSEQIAVSNLIVAEIQLPTGHHFVKQRMSSDLNVESQDDGNLIILYINKMTNGQKVSYGFDAKKSYDINMYSDSYVKVYDYYQPNLNEIGYYNVNSRCLKPVNLRGKTRQRP